MITKENFKSVIKSLDPDDVYRVMITEETDDIAVYCSSYGGAFIISWDGLDDPEDVLSTGGFIIDKDNFYIMCREAGIDMEKFLEDYPNVI